MKLSRSSFYYRRKAKDPDRMKAAAARRFDEGLQKTAEKASSERVG